MPSHFRHDRACPILSPCPSSGTTLWDDVKVHWAPVDSDVQTWLMYVNIDHFISYLLFVHSGSLMVSDDVIVVTVSDE